MAKKARYSGILTINREGQFPLRALGPNHCGVAEHLTVRYHMVCECQPKLDGRGFLFDQLGVDAFFQAIGTTKLSCEQLTLRSLYKLVRAIRKENPGCVINRAKLTLSPSPHAASMTYEWAGR